MPEVNEEVWSPWLDELEAVVDAMPGHWSDGTKRNVEGTVLPSYRTAIHNQQKSIHEAIATRSGKEHDDLFTVGARELGETVDRAVERYEAGEIDAQELRRVVSAVDRDLRRCRTEGAKVRKAEQEAWERCSMPAAKFQRAMADRFPPLYQNGRGRPQITRAVLEGRQSFKF